MKYTVLFSVFSKKNIFNGHGVFIKKHNSDMALLTCADLCQKQTPESWASDPKYLFIKMEHLVSGLQSWWSFKATGWGKRLQPWPWTEKGEIDVYLLTLYKHTNGGMGGVNGCVITKTRGRDPPVYPSFSPSTFLLTPRTNSLSSPSPFLGNYKVLVYTYLKVFTVFFNQKKT